MKKQNLSIFLAGALCFLFVFQVFGAGAQEVPEEGPKIISGRTGAIDTSPVLQDAVPSTGLNDSAFDAYRQSMDGGNDPFDQILSNNMDGPPAPGQETPEDLQTEIRREAFDAAINGMLPLKPEEIRRFLEIYDEVKQASNTPLFPYPKQEMKVEEISLDPADPPKVIKLATGHVSMVSFMDATGAQWPIVNMTWAGDFEISPPEEGGYSIRVTPLSDFAYGNMIVTMSMLKTPVIFTLQAQRDVAYVRYDAIIPQPGPFATPSLIGGAPAVTTTSGSVQTVAVLDGSAPQGSSAMLVEGVDGRTRAYESSGLVYLRTPYTLISPAWSESATSADGTNVYVIKKTPVVLLSEKGKILRVFLKEKESSM
ncbi:MAG: type IV secretion protein DotH [Rhodospirillales bacterium]|nr:type IV secretion protein DotH [Rhodospirillales bacterium]MCB9965030.1 type IV secretion protein DotH [Rhodospirillales bacterium]MCB9980358.1 type IV secretion protein DotH [Rhodospirillales bacterium]